MAHEYDRLPEQKPILLRLGSDFDFVKMRQDAANQPVSRPSPPEKAKPDAVSLIEQLAGYAAEGARGPGGVASFRAARNELSKRLAAMQLPEAEQLVFIQNFERRWSELFVNGDALALERRMRSHG